MADEEYTEQTNKGYTKRLPTPKSNASLVLPEDLSEKIYSFFSPNQLGKAFHESEWTPEMCVATLVELAQNCPDQKIRMEAIKYLDEKAKQSMMLSGRMSEVKQSLTKKLPDGTTAEMTATTLAHMSSSAKVLEALGNMDIPPNEVIQMDGPKPEEPNDVSTPRRSTSSASGLPGNDTRRSKRKSKPRPGPGPAKATGSAPGVQPSQDRSGPPGDDGRDRESNPAAPSRVPAKRQEPFPPLSDSDSPPEMVIANAGDTIFDATAPPINYNLEPTDLIPVEAGLPEQDRCVEIADEELRGHHPPTVDTGTGLANSPD